MQGDNFYTSHEACHSTYSINRVPLEIVSKMHDLGVMLDSNLTFGPHIDSVVGRANRALETFLRSLQTSRVSASRRVKPSSRIAGFNGHVRSILEFGSIIWSGAAAHIVRRERVQHKFLIWLAANCDSSSAPFEYPHLLSYSNFLRVSAPLALAQRDLTFVHGVQGSPAPISLETEAILSGVFLCLSVTSCRSHSHRTV